MEPKEWVVAQVWHRFFAFNKFTLEIYDPESVVSEHAMWEENYRFTKERAIELVDKMNIKSPLVKVTRVGN